ncbi:MAG: N-acetylmuramic acid 6-phosphate etherase [Candidatus Diapherotrites archaeon]
MDVNKLRQIKTEKYNSNSKGIDGKSIREIIDLVHVEHHGLVEKLDCLKEKIAAGTELIVVALQKGNTLYFVGSGTSGRLGILQSAECPPTFSTDALMIQSFIAGGESAFLSAKEGAEDSFDAGHSQLNKIIKKHDVVVGLAASGRTPYVIGALQAAKEKGAFTIVVTTNPGCELGKIADVDISVDVNPPLIVGSTRWTPGTAQKMVLDELTSIAMIALGRVYDGYMVALKTNSNEKTQARAVSNIMCICGMDEEKAGDALRNADGDCMAAIVMVKKKIQYGDAVKLLNQHNRNLRKIIG